jgi:Mce-associated membrane protein
MAKTTEDAAPGAMAKTTGPAAPGATAKTTEDAASGNRAVEPDHAARQISSPPHGLTRIPGLGGLRRIAALPGAFRRLLALLRDYRGPAVLIAAARELALAGGGLTFATATLRASPAAANRALADVPATGQVAAAVSAEAAAIFSYSYTDIPATRRAAASVLSGAAARQYDELFSGVVARYAPGEKLTVTTRVVRAGVTWLSGGTARLLVFLDQQATRPGGYRDTTAAQLAVTAQLADGRWLITGLQAR